MSATEQSYAAFRRDVPQVAVRALLLVLALSVGGQVVQALGGSDGHVALLRMGPPIGLLFSIAYARFGRGRSPLTMVFWPQGLSFFLIASLVGLGHFGDFVSPAAHFALTGCLAVAASAIALPFVSTVYGLVYPPLRRARLVAYGRMVNGVVAMVAGWSLGRLLAGDVGLIRVVAPVLAVMGLAANLYFYRMPVAAARTPQSSAERSAWEVIRRDRNFRRFQYFQFILGFANLMSIPLIDLFVRRELGLGIDLAVLVVAQGVVMQGVVLVTVRWQSTLFDRLGIVRHRVVTSCCLGFGYLLWANADGLPMAIAAAGLIGFGMSGGQLIWLIGSLSFARREELTTYSSIHTFLTGIRGVIAPAAGVLLLRSELIAGDFRRLFLLTSALIFISALGHGLLVHGPRGDRGDGAVSGAVTRESSQAR